MLTVEIEKEIQQENKILLNFTLRQVVCLCVAAVLGVVCAVFLDMEFSLAVYPCLAAGGICFAFGWWKVDGLPMERVLLKKLQAGVYQNNVRLYKTKNRYIVMLNREYGKRLAADWKDRRKRKRLKKGRRLAGKKRKRSRYQVIV